MAFGDGAEGHEVITWAEVWKKAWVIAILGVKRETNMRPCPTLWGDLLRSAEARCEWGLKCLGGDLKNALELADSGRV